MNRIFYALFICLITIIVNCDPGGYLLLKNGKFNTTVSLNECTLELSMLTLGNISYELYINIMSNSDVVLFLDSLKITYQGEQLEYEIRDDNGILSDTILKVKKGNESISYSFRLNRQNIRKNDEIILYAQNYLKQDDTYFSIEDTRFIINKIY